MLKIWRRIYRNLYKVNFETVGKTSDRIPILFKPLEKTSKLNLAKSSLYRTL